MKSPTIAPVFACFYAGLCDIARAKGYALAVHGTMSRDLDLVAVPWVEDAVSAEDLKKALEDHLNACGFKESLRRSLFSEQVIETSIAALAEDPDAPSLRPHGRVSWLLYVANGVTVDLSVMPRKPA